jgi:hypothetical protein
MLTRCCAAFFIATLLASASATAETITQSVRLPASGEAAGQHNPPCVARINARTVAADVVAKLGGAALSAYTGSALPATIANSPEFTDWWRGVTGTHNGPSTCGGLCFVVPASANVRGNARVISSKHSWPPPGDPGFLPTDQYYENDGLPWSGIPGPTIQISGDTKLMCWVTKNWSENLDRVIEITLRY